MAVSPGRVYSFFQCIYTPFFQFKLIVQACRSDMLECRYGILGFSSRRLPLEYIAESPTPEVEPDTARAGELV